MGFGPDQSVPVTVAGGFDLGLSDRVRSVRVRLGPSGQEPSGGLVDRPPGLGSRWTRPSHSVGVSR